MTVPKSLAEMLSKANLVDALTADLATISTAAAHGSRWGQSFNRQHYAHETVRLETTPAEALETARRAAAAIGKILAEAADEETGAPTLLVRTRAGWLNLNPALLLVAVEADEDGTVLKLTAAALEGLINQGTAGRAVRRFIQALPG